MPTPPQHASRTFPAEARSAARARHFTREKLQEWGASDMVDSAALLVSELLTNAVVHTGTEARLELRLDSHSLRIEVEDRHPVRAVPPLPTPAGEESESGRGLLITSSLASSWGVEYTSGTKLVWARCERDLAPVERRRPFTSSETDRDVHAQIALVELAADGRVSAWSADAEQMFGRTADDAIGRSFHEMIDPVPGERPPTAFPSTSQGSWQGAYRVLLEDGSPLDVFASHTAAPTGEGVVVLLVRQELQALIEHPALPRVVSRSEFDPLGLRDDALLRLGIDDYLTLAVERARDAVSADASYLLLFRDFDDAYEMVAASGLPDTVRGARLDPGALGTPDPRTPRLPVLVHHLPDTSSPLLAGAEMGSLLVAPVVVEGRVVGALGAASEHPSGFDNEQSALLQRCADAIALATDRARLQASERERRGWLSFIAEAGDLLAGSLDQSMTMAIIGQITVPRIASWCAVYLDDDRGKSVLRHVWHADEDLVDPLRDALAASGPPPTSDSSDVLAGDAVTAIPLIARGRQIGSMVLGRSKGDPLRNELVLVTESVARRAALAIDNAEAHGELQAVGEALQQSLLPHSMPEAPGLDVGVVYEAAGERTAAGGDFYDFFPVAGGDWCFVVGDVCGTGAEAAAVTGLARHTIRALTHAGFPVAATLERLNTAILDEGSRARFLTLVCGILHHDGRRVRMSLVNAGHPPPFVVGSDGAVRQISGPQALLGVIDNVSYVAEQHVLEPGDLLVALTDGVLERRDGDKMLDDQGVATELASASRLPAQAVAERIRRLVVDFTHEPPHDDMAVLAIRLDPSSAP